MSQESQRIALMTKQDAVNAQLGIPVLMGNDDLSPPTNAPYAEFWILGGKPIPIGGVAEGKICERTAGMIQLTVWVPKGKGTGASSRAADTWGKAWRYARFTDAEGCRYKFDGLETINPTTKEGWSVTVNRITFYRDDFIQIPISISQ